MNERTEAPRLGIGALSWALSRSRADCPHFSKFFEWFDGWLDKQNDEQSMTGRGHFQRGFAVYASTEAGAPIMFNIDKFSSRNTISSRIRVLEPRGVHKFSYMACNRPSFPWRAYKLQIRWSATWNFRSARDRPVCFWSFFVFAPWGPCSAHLS